jgi:putative tricarboxylic transport membrane protein
MRKLTTIAIFTLIILTTVSVFGEGQKDASYPSKDIQYICNSGAGGGTDTISRKLASIIEKAIDPTIAVINKPGKGEAEGPYSVMRGRPDGYTIGNITYGAVVGAIYYKLIPQYDIDKLEIVCVVTQEADALMVKADAPWKTYEEFIAAAKAAPGELSIGITAIGGRPSMITTQMEALYGVEFQQIEYVDGAGPQREALLSGEVDAVITSLGDFAAVLKSGAVRGLVEYSTLQNETYTDVPTIASKGNPEMEMGSFLAIVAPKGTPEDVLDTLEKLYYDAQHSDDFRNWTLSVGVTAGWYGRDKATDFVKSVMASNFKTLDQMRAAGIIE